MPHRYARTKTYLLLAASHTCIAYMHTNIGFFFFRLLMYLCECCFVCDLTKSIGHWSKRSHTQTHATHTRIYITIHQIVQTKIWTLHVFVVYTRIIITRSKAFQSKCSTGMKKESTSSPATTTTTITSIFYVEIRVLCACIYCVFLSSISFLVTFRLRSNGCVCMHVAPVWTMNETV